MASLSFLYSSTTLAALVVISATLFSFYLTPSQWNLMTVPSSPCGLLGNSDFILKSSRVVTSQGVIPAAIEVRSGKITAVISGDALLEGAFELHTIDYGNAVISPGLVDLHVHMNEPGREEWEGVETATKAAAAGGITFIGEMPLNSFPTTVSVETLNLKLASTKGKLMVDVGYWAGLVPENAFDSEKLEALLQAGVLGLKSFMCPSGINDFPDTNVSHMKAALPLLARHKRQLFVHSEVVQPLENLEAEEGDPKKYATYLASRPPEWEIAAIKELVELSKGTATGGIYEGAKLHVVHLSASDCLPLLQGAKEAGASLSVETCPHYLSFTAEQIEDGQTQYKCAPPIRSEANQAILWRAVKEGKIDTLASDHSPAPPGLKKLKEGDFLKAWGGISGIQFNLPSTWTFGRKHDISISQLAELWSRKPAELASLHNKGSISVGKDADFVVWDPEASFAVDENFSIFHKHKLTPYSGHTFSGVVLSTYVRGQLVYENGTHANTPCGSQILLH